MIGALTNHLWQSTLFAIVPALLTVAFRKNRAAIRYWLWFSASLKFFIPFSLLMLLGSRVAWAPPSKALTSPPVSLTVDQFAQPFPVAVTSLSPTAATSADWLPFALLGVWLCGFASIALIRIRDWRRIRAAVRSSTPIDIPEAVEVRSSPGLLEPGVVGLFRPILLLPAGIVDRLTPPQLEAVLAHELSHVRRRDNLTSATHMIVETIFWFHPLIWWIGARQMEERERACDEAVLKLGNAPRDYAEGILNVCKLYIESPLVCVSGVTGSNLKKRLRAILAGHIPRSLNLPSKLVLGVAAIAALAVPIMIGMINAPPIASLSPSEPAPKFATASITSCPAFSARPVPESPGRLQTGCTTLQRLIERAYGPFSTGHMDPSSSVTVTGGPTWINSEPYQIDAKAPGQSQSMMNGPMLKALLKDKFNLEIHRETRDVPVYALTAPKHGVNLQPFQGSCIPWDSAHRDPAQMCGRVVNRTSSGFDLDAAEMADLCFFLNVTLDRPVIDKTGITGRFVFHMDVPTEELRHQARGIAAFRNPASPAPPPASPAFIAAAKTSVHKLGLNLEPTNGPAEFIVIDSVAKP